MIPIKILCPCGAKYAFEAEPVDGQLPAPVACPKCGADGTSAANESIRLQLAGAGPSAAAPEPAVPSLVPKPPSGVRLRVAGAHAAAPEPAAEAPAETVRVEPVVSEDLRPAAARKKKKRELAYGEANMQWASMGAIGAGLVAMTLWWASIHYLEFRWGILAWIVGGIVGVGGRLAGGGSSQKLGLLCGACALAAIVGGQFIDARIQLNAWVQETIDESYNEEMATAQKAVKAETDAQIREHLAAEYSFESDRTKPEDITEAEITNFKEEQKRYRDIVDGKITKEEYAKDIEAVSNSGAANFVLLLYSIGFKGIIFLILGVGTAYKLGSGMIE